jgi:hypothetical protein
MSNRAFYSSAQSQIILAHRMGDLCRDLWVTPLFEGLPVETQKKAGVNPMQWPTIVGCAATV